MKNVYRGSRETTIQRWVSSTTSFLHLIGPALNALAMTLVLAFKTLENNCLVKCYHIRILPYFKHFATFSYRPPIRGFGYFQLHYF